jgi:hypothetical protein
VKNRYWIDTISIFTILTNTIRYRYGIDASGIEAEPGSDWSERALKVGPSRPEKMMTLHSFIVIIISIPYFPGETNTYIRIVVPRSLSRAIGGT